MKEYIENINIKYSEIEQNLALKPYALLNYLQDIASKSAEDLGFGYSYMHPLNYAWFLIKYRMEFIDYPYDVQNLSLKTAPRGYNKLFAYRNFEILKENKIIAKISSTWSVINTVNHSMVPVQVALLDNPNMQVFKKSEDDLSYEKIILPQNFDIEKKFEVRYTDLDVNKHVNNGNYIIWAFEPLDFEFKNIHKIKILDMVYKKEVKFNEVITSCVKFKDDNTTIHCIKNENMEEVCNIQCVWE